MDSTLLTIPATITKVTTMSNRAIKLTVDSQEDLSDEEIAKVIAFYDQFGWFLFAREEREIKPEDLVNLPKVKREHDEKTPTQRLRSRLFVFYKDTHTDTTGFNSWFEKILDQIGQKYLDKLNE